MEPSETILYSGRQVRFVELDGRRWVAAIDVAKALRYPFPTSLPTRGDRKNRYFGGDPSFQLEDHRRRISLKHESGFSRQTWVYDRGGFEYELWPRFRCRRTDMQALGEAIRKTLEDG